MLNLLLAWKADKELRNNIGKAPRDLAPEGRSDAVQALQRTIIKYETPVPWSTELSTQHAISKDFNVDVTFTSFKSTEPFTWTRSLPISEFLRRDTLANMGGQNDDKHKLGETNGVENSDGTRHDTAARGGKMARFESDRNDANAGATKAGSKSHHKHTGRDEGTGTPNILGSLQEQFLEMVRLEGWKISSKNVMRWIHLPNNNWFYTLDDMGQEVQFGQYDGSSGLQLPETFDQSYYDGSTSLDERNTDQVVYKWLTDTNDGSEPKILVVRQLWIWRLDERTVVTAIPPRWDEEPKETLYDLISRSLPQAALATPHALIQQILLQCLPSPNEFEQAGVGYHILDIFESWIAKQQDREVALFRAFRKFIEDSDDVTEDHTDQNALQIDQEVKIIYELKDALEELFILRQLFITQQKIASSYHEMNSPHYYRHGEGHGISQEDFKSQSGLEGLIGRADRLEANAKMVLENVDHLVSVKQTQSSLIQSQLAAKQAEVANNQAKLAHEEARRSRQLNNYVLLFTSVTIIFTPLAFMISMFAVPIQGFPRDDNGELFYGSSWITGRLFAGELVTLFVVILGFLLIRRMNRDEKDLPQFNAQDMVPPDNAGVVAGRPPVSFHDKPPTGQHAIHKRSPREAISSLGPRLRARVKELRGRQPGEDVERQQPSNGGLI
ncbi:hypothetical protein QBC40DRAFT_319836 [Triangularia verruculosa]|uniref:Uncharacterized protein n=1 Tax=Triangularia verruculosa TaxID=2587418 RepID=A0AAN6X7Q5_9PEZI|nr:hypothetical protein QBC40DRAFT_319836 [Triangularia verruculosa]